MLNGKQINEQKKLLIKTTLLIYQNCKKVCIMYPKFRLMKIWNLQIMYIYQINVISPVKIMSQIIDFLVYLLFRESQFNSYNITKRTLALILLFQIVLTVNKIMNKKNC